MSRYAFPSSHNMDRAHAGRSPARARAREQRLGGPGIWLAVLATLLVGVFVAYLLAGYLVIPYLARTRLQSFVQTHYGRALTVREIQFNPLTFRMEASGVSLPDADGRPMLGFEHLRAQPSLASFWHLAPSFREIVLEKPEAHVVLRHDGSLNLADLAKGLNTKPSAPGGRPMQLFIESLRVLGGSGSFEDRTLPAPFIEHLHPINFELRNFSTQTQTGGGNLYALTATSTHGAHLKWNGSFTLQPLASHGTLDLTGLPLRTLWAYARSPLPIATPPGTVALHGRYEAALSGRTLGLKVQLPDMTVTGLKLRPGSAAQDYIDLPRIAVSNTSVDLQQHSVDIGQVMEEGGRIDAWLAKGGTHVNLLEMLPAEGAASASSSAATPAPSAATSTATASASGVRTSAHGKARHRRAAAHSASSDASAGTLGGWHVRAPDIEVRHLKIAAEDRQVTPVVQYTADALDVKVSGYSSAPGTELGVTINSVINGGKLEIKGKVNPDTHAATGTVTLAGLDLRGLQPYLASQTGMMLISGNLGTHLGVERTPAGVLTVQGDADVRDLRTVDNEARQDLIRWQDMRINQLHYASQPQNLQVDTVTLHGPYARVIVFPNLTTNISEILTPTRLLHGRPRLENAPEAESGGAEGGTAPPDNSGQPPPQGANEQAKEQGAKDGGKEAAPAAAPQQAAQGAGNAPGASSGAAPSAPENAAQQDPQQDKSSPAAAPAQSQGGTQQGAKDGSNPRANASASEQSGGKTGKDETSTAAAPVQSSSEPQATAATLDSGAAAPDQGAQNKDNKDKDNKDKSAPPAQAEAATKSANEQSAKGQGANDKGQQGAAAAAGSRPLVPFPATIKTVKVIDGSANYADYWIQPHFAVGIQTLNGTVSGISSDPQSRAQVELEGKVDRYAPAHIAGTMNLLSAFTYSDMYLSFKGVDMTSVTPYSGHFAGYKIDKGKMSVDLNYKIENRHLNAKQHFVLNQLQLGEKVDSKAAVKLPVKLAVALLKDKNGVIDIGLPMTGSLDDPHFKIGPLIWKAFVNLLGKVATAPFALLGHLFGGGETMNLVEFAPGSATLTPEASKKLGSVVKALNERPALQLEIPAAYADRDRQGLAELRILQQQKGQKAQSKKASAEANEALANDTVLASPSRRFRLLVSAYRSTANGADLPDSVLEANEAGGSDPATLAPAISELEAAVLPHYPVTDSDLEQLGARRAQAIEDALVAAGVDPQRLFILKEHHAGAGVKGGSGAKESPNESANEGSKDSKDIKSNKSLGSDKVAVELGLD